MRNRVRVGLRGHARDLRPAGPARPRRRRAHRSVLPPQPIGHGTPVDRRLRRYRSARRGGRERGGGDREPHRALYLAETPGTPREGSRGLHRDNKRGRACRSRKARDGGGLCALGGRDPVQRPRPLPGGGVGGPASHRGHRLPNPSMWAWPELIEAAARGGDAGLARWALERLAETTQPCGGDVALGIEARSRALLSDGAAAEPLYREAIDRLSRTQVRPDLARAHLVYGEWLRREGRRVDARGQLRTAHDMLDAIGMEAFAERARRELIATGEKVRKRGVEARDQLTPQEEQIARLARDGRTNPQIGAQLFLSTRTVEWHLRKVFTKLGIGSRHELRAALASLGQDGQPT